MDEMKKEKAKLKNTTEAISSLLKEVDISINTSYDSSFEFRKYLWNDRFDIDHYEISVAMSNINSDMSKAQEIAEKRYKLHKSLSNPYFARIDFKTGDTEKKYYIGLNGVMKDYIFHVYDWRTPVASLFYNCGLGQASFDAPKGVISGEISLKRQFKIANGKIELCFDSNLNINDEYLQDILSNTSSKHMGSIVTTIQQEQNQIIRNITDKVLLVQGIAGSGKSSVALHRIAYLLYKEKHLTSANVLIFSPNDIFSEYISNVLPELGEENVLQTTFSDFAKAFVKGFNKIESFSEFIERHYNSRICKKTYNTIKFKFSDEYTNELNIFLAKHTTEIAFIEEIEIKNGIYSTTFLNEFIQKTYIRLPLNERFIKITEFICDEQKISYGLYGKGIIDLLKSKVDRTTDTLCIYNCFLSEKMYKNIENQDIIYYEDLPPLIYTQFFLSGYPNTGDIKHVVIDEAQDYNLLQFSLLKSLFKNASFTILGDVNQTINPYFQFSSFNILNKIFSNLGKYIELNKTYRSSEEIIKYSNTILNLKNVVSIRKKNSNPVVLRRVDNKNLVNALSSDIKSLLENGLKKIAIICKSNEQALYIVKIMSGKIKNIRYIDDTYVYDEKHIIVTPSYLSKGLEFDAVISYTDETNKYDSSDKHLLYVVCTRAQHSLIIYNP